MIQELTNGTRVDGHVAIVAALEDEQSRLAASGASSATARRDEAEVAITVARAALAAPAG